MEEWFRKSDDEIKAVLLKAWKLNELILTGIYRRKSEKDHGSFVEVRTLDYVALNFPAIEHLGDEPIWVFNFHQEGMVNEKRYIFKAKFQAKKHRIIKRNPFLLMSDTKSFQIVPYNPDPKEFIERRFDIAASTLLLSEDQLSKSIETITSEINKSPETFIYELLQNADDYPVKGQPVRVGFEVKSDLLLFTHTGKVFEVNNVHAICGVNEKDKSEDTEKIGFKGIGFKSVFKDCDYVLINSGGYRFRFDKNAHLTKTYWETIPIWTEKEGVQIINAEFWNQPVGILLKPRDKDLLHNVEFGYAKILKSIFEDDRILLFLRNIDEVLVKENGIELACSKDFKNWRLDKYTVELPQTEQAWLNEQIKSSINRNKRIPEKFYNLSRTNISFATSRDSNKILVTENSKLFVYLPTQIDLKFPFLLNGDFIPDGSRLELHDLQWNTFLLMGELSHKLF